MKIEIPNELFNEEELKNTPDRIKRFYSELEKRRHVEFTVFPNKDPETTGMVILKNIKYDSLCSHHLLPFTGTAHIGYIPDKIRCGISKLARIVDKFAAKPNVQEILNYEVIEYLQRELEPKGLIVLMTAQHQCMACRGVKKDSARMITSEVRGVFLKHELGKNPKDEFLKLIQLGDDV